MNSSTLIGLVVGVIMLAVVVATSSLNALAYLNLHGLAIVLGGTAAAVLIGYPWREVRRLPVLLRTVLRGDRADTQRDIDELVAMSQLWMNEDIHTAERELKKVSNPFLRTGVQLLIDNTPEDQIIELMQWRIARLRAREHAEAQMFRVMAGFAPAFGMLGTLVGLINLMTLLGAGSVDAIGQQMAIALMATFYGLLLANLICKPIAVKLERRTEQRLVVMNMVMQGIAMMCEKRGPAMVRETLHSFMAHVEDEIYDGGDTVTGPDAGPIARTAPAARASSRASAGQAAAKAPARPATATRAPAPAQAPAPAAAAPAPARGASAPLLTPRPNPDGKPNGIVAAKAAQAAHDALAAALTRR
ncbi:Flagellar motor rotation protein MotA [plant metagenome]|uniref:Flagellar motor rotation protein MotA n=1 Tax=plant metagenome TaxID=1297885 RepID=A0A484QDW4_9ZZZZ